MQTHTWKKKKTYNKEGPGLLSGLNITLPKLQLHQSLHFLDIYGLLLKEEVVLHSIKQHQV